MRQLSIEGPGPVPGWLDITLAEEQFVLDGLNGHWAADGDEIYHWCIIDNCPLGCGGDEETSWSLVVLCLRLVASPNMKAPLEYRWKGMEQA